MDSEVRMSHVGRKVLLTGLGWVPFQRYFEEIDGNFYATIVEEHEIDDPDDADFNVQDREGDEWAAWSNPDEIYAVDLSAPVPSTTMNPKGSLYALSGTDYSVGVAIEDDGEGGYDVFLYEDLTQEEVIGARYIPANEMNEERLERAVAEMVEIAITPSWTGVYVAPENMETE